MTTILEVSRVAEEVVRAAGAMIRTAFHGPQRLSFTIGFEKRFNPSLRLDKAFFFVRELTADVAPRPDDIDRIIFANIAA